MSKPTTTRSATIARRFRWTSPASLVPPIAVLAAVVVAVSAGRSAKSDAAEPTPVSASPILAFLQTHCRDCHADGASEGGLDLDTLGQTITGAADLAAWVRIHDRVQAGEMPPPDATTLNASDRSDFTTALAAPLTQHHAAEKGTVLRRLNRREYENTLNDLFGTAVELETLLPADGRSHEFDNVGEALGISMVHLERYLDAADLVLDTAIAKTAESPETHTIETHYAETREAETHLGKVWKQLDDGSVVFYQDFGYPDGMLRTTSIPESGRYRISITGYAHQTDEKIPFYVGAKSFARGSERPTLGYFDMPPLGPNGEMTTIELTADLEYRYMLNIIPYGLVVRDYHIRNEGVDGYTGPGLAIAKVRVEGPLHEEFPSRGHRLIFDGWQRNEIMPTPPSKREKSWYKPEFELTSDNVAESLRGTLQRVGSTVMRRPVTDVELLPYINLFHAEQERDASTEEALRTAVAAILCSPDFLYLREPAGKLDDHALATRLSYFFHRTTPDADLLRAAEQHELTQSTESLLQHAKRLIGDPRFDRFVIDFTDAWLNLRDIDQTSPDQKLFPEYDRYLRDSMLEETRQFFATLIRENLPVTNLVKSDFAMLNLRLADHYGIEGVDHADIRRVPLPNDSVRGGLLGQASVLKVTANGTNTSPVVRGVWVTERLLGVHPAPPPPGISGVEPDIRGAATLRQLLDQHRNEESCRACHALIDPPGFALESFNPIGGWRDRYRSLGEGERIDLRVNNRRVQYRLGLPVDSSGTLPSGESFEGFEAFRECLLENPDQLAKSLITKWLTFATGREMGFSDREEIESLTRQSARRGHRLRSMLALVVASKIFRTK
ncbi:DUF1592 domain-containing protein [Rhodopirellula sp. P2]|uniref:DUF1592 domain-containing protein n=1 Tax=Rhodopirellula sp. P2 TaxID=2127060 RepID=UPI0023676648|nr:DUF1592 domain-containing protein [Rhodopirellula sp. P2]WDQ16261.1 DUF1592 domain-containing protein [Rhodopirellula sp. P2]